MQNVLNILIELSQNPDLLTTPLQKKYYRYRETYLFVCCKEFVINMKICRGVLRNLKPSVFRPSQVKKKGQHALSCSIFRPKSRREQKKVITPSDFPLYAYHLYTTKVLCICLREGGVASAVPPGYAPDMLLYH